MSGEETIAEAEDSSSSRQEEAENESDTRQPAQEEEEQVPSSSIERTTSPPETDDDDDDDDESSTSSSVKIDNDVEATTTAKKPDPPEILSTIAITDDDDNVEAPLTLQESSASMTTTPAGGDAAAAVANREARLQQRLRRLRNLVFFCGCLLVLVIIVAILVAVFAIQPGKNQDKSLEETPTSPSPTRPSRPDETPYPPSPTPPSSDPPNKGEQGPCVCAPCPCVTPYQRRGNVDLEGYAGFDASTVDLSADGNILVIRQGGATGNNDGDILQAWTYDATQRIWVTRGTPMVGPGSAGTSHGAPVFSLSADGNFLVMGSTLIQFWTYDSDIDAWWGPSAGDAVGQPSTTGNPTPDAGYSGSYSVTLSDDGNRLVMAGNAMEIQPNVVHVFDRQNVANWVRAGSPFYNEQPTDVTFAATISGDGLTVALGAPDNNAGGYNLSGHVRVFRWDPVSEDWQPLGQTLEDPGPFRRFGNQVHLSFDGNVLAAQTLTGVRLFRFDEATISWLAYGENEIACRPSEPTWVNHFSALSGNGQVLAVAGCFGLGTAVDKDGMYGANGNVRVFEVQQDATETSDPWRRVGETDLYGLNQEGSVVGSLALSFDGRILATSSTGGATFTNEFGFTQREPGMVRVFERAQ